MARESEAQLSENKQIQSKQKPGKVGDTVGWEVPGELQWPQESSGRFENADSWGGPSFDSVGLDRPSNLHI